jgi:PAS domain S-box-containing protein
MTADLPSVPDLALVDRSSLSLGSGLLEAVPAAAYATDAEGRVTHYNRMAAELWGLEPKAGVAQFCGSWRLYRPDGRALPHTECALAVALRERRPLRGVEAVVERPDGSRVAVLNYPTPLLDEHGELDGMVNMMVQTGDRGMAAQHLAAIVESSDDAILSKDLNGTIISWNLGAERIFGYTAEEAVGRSITLIIPPERLEEETEILAKLGRGERIDHFETVRRCKDGTLLDISLTVSPIRGADGAVVGASKVARDITDRRRAEERQRLLLNEMNHRVKNLMVLAGSVVSLSARSATDVQQLVDEVRERLAALARAHELTLPKDPEIAEDYETSTTLHALIRTIVAAFDERQAAAASRVSISGVDVDVAAGGPLTSLALLLHEFAANAAKYGALSTPSGRVEITCAGEGEELQVTWTEHDGPTVSMPTDEADGFGSLLTRATVRNQLGGSIERDWRPDGLVIRLSVARERLAR